MSRCCADLTTSISTGSVPDRGDDDGGDDGGDDDDDDDDDDDEHAARPTAARTTATFERIFTGNHQAETEPGRPTRLGRLNQ